MDLLDSIEQTPKLKIFHLEAFEGNRIFVGAGIKANNLQEAEMIMKVVFMEGTVRDVDIYLIEEHWIH